MDTAGTAAVPSQAGSAPPGKEHRHQGPSMSPLCSTSSSRCLNRDRESRISTVRLNFNPSSTPLVCLQIIAMGTGVWIQLPQQDSF